MEKWKFMCTVGGNVKNFHYESFSINEKYNCYMIQQFHFYLFKEIENTNLEKIYAFLVHCSISHDMEAT